MRIVADDPARLVLRDRTLWVSVICLGGALAVTLLVLKRHAPAVQLVPAGLFVLFGLLFLRATDVVFDKVSRRCSIRRLDVLRVRRQALPFETITDVRVEPIPMSSDQVIVPCRLALLTAEGAVPLTASYEPDFERHEAMRETIVGAVFANRPRPAATDHVRWLVDAGRRIDAIDFLRRRDGLSLTDAKARVDALAATVA